MPLLPASLPERVVVDTTLANPSLTLTYTGTGAEAFAITGITYTVNGVSATAIPDTRLPDLTFTCVPTLQQLANSPDYSQLNYSASASVTIGGKYSLSIFDLNSILSIPRGGTDKDDPSTVTDTRTFLNLATNNRQVFKLSPDNRIIPVVYTVSYVLRVTIAGTAATTTGGVTTAATLGSVTYTPQTAAVTQTVINNYDALGAALLLVIR